MKRIEITCDDGRTLRGHRFEQAAPHAPASGIVVIASATGVLSTYYHRYAAFPAGHGFNAITFDYRGIGGPAPESFKDFRVRWHGWGYHDIDAALGRARKEHSGQPLQFVGHSFGGFAVGLARESSHLIRILLVGTQRAYWRDSAHGQGA